MNPGPPRSTRPDQLFPHTTLVAVPGLPDELDLLGKRGARRLGDGQHQRDTAADGDAVHGVGADAVEVATEPAGPGQAVCGAAVLAAGHGAEVAEVHRGVAVPLTPVAPTEVPPGPHGTP